MYSPCASIRCASIEATAWGEGRAYLAFSSILVPGAPRFPYARRSDICLRAPAGTSTGPALEYGEGICHES